MNSMIDIAKLILLWLSIISFCVFMAWFQNGLKAAVTLAIQLFALAMFLVIIDFSGTEK